MAKKGQKEGQFYTGTSNVAIPGNKQSFPEVFQSRSRLHYYGTLFNSVEVNQSFYKTPLRSTYAKWAEEVPAGFKFSVKLSKEITHSKNLQNDLSTVQGFMDAAAGLGAKKGCLLIQFPGKITLDYYKQVERIVDAVQQSDPGNEWRKAVEFRHPGWYTGETWELLNEYGAAMVLQDHPKAKLLEVSGKASFVYIRFHGPTGNYRESYSTGFLQARAADIKSWLLAGKDVYTYFNNTIGNAFENAQSLHKMIHFPAR